MGPFRWLRHSGGHLLRLQASSADLLRPSLHLPGADWHHRLWACRCQTGSAPVHNHSICCGQGKMALPNIVRGNEGETAAEPAGDAFTLNPHTLITGLHPHVAELHP